jgi:hypothetical protein
MLDRRKVKAGERFVAKRQEMKRQNKKATEAAFYEKTVGTRERERSLPASLSFLWSQ